MMLCFILICKNMEWKMKHIKQPNVDRWHQGKGHRWKSRLLGAETLEENKWGEVRWGRNEEKQKRKEKDSSMNYRMLCFPWTVVKIPGILEAISSPQLSPTFELVTSNVCSMAINDNVKNHWVHANCVDLAASMETKIICIAMEV